MDGNHGDSSVRVPHIEMAAFLSDALESKAFEDADEPGGFEDRKFAHAGTLTC